MRIWRKVRLILLILLTALVCFALAGVVFRSGFGGASAIVFPLEVAVSGWESAGSAPVGGGKGDGAAETIPGRRYQYRSNNIIVNIEVRYLADSNGNVEQYMADFAATPPGLEVKNRPDLGFYGLQTHSGRAFLTAAINSKGGATVTRRQFARNRDVHDRGFDRLLPWLIGRQPLRDTRCLWVGLSMTATPTAPEQAYALLESIWDPWCRWWMANFPQK